MWSARRRRNGGRRVLTSFETVDGVPSVWLDPDFQKLLRGEQRGWRPRLDGVRAREMTAGLGFAGLIQPNVEPVVAPSATTGVTAETNLYTPATTTNAAWALFPIGSLRSPQRIHVNSTGIITSSAASQTCAWTARIGTSSTPSSNASLGATGAVALGSTITNALWEYDAWATVRSVGSGTSASMVSHAVITISQQAAGSVTSVGVGMSGNTTATFDSTIQQGYVISVTPSATGVSVQLTQFSIEALD